MLTTDPRRAAALDSALLTGLADASTQDHSTGDKQFPGLHNDLLFLWAMVDTEDGKRYELIRCMSASATFDFNLHECSTDLWTHPTNLRFPGENDLYWGPILWFDVGGKQTFFPANRAMSKRHPISISLGPKEYVWKEHEDCIDVVLTPLPMNVTSIYVPGLPDDVGYTSSGCTVEGSIEGSKIKGGYGGLDRMYCLPGLSAQVSKIAELEHYWFVWGSILSDGRWETANAMLGAGKYATATFQRQGEGPIIATNDDVKSKVPGKPTATGDNPLGRACHSVVAPSISRPLTTRLRPRFHWASPGCTGRCRKLVARSRSRAGRRWRSSRSARHHAIRRPRVKAR